MPRLPREAKDGAPRAPLPERLRRAGRVRPGGGGRKAERSEEDAVGRTDPPPGEQEQEHARDEQNAETTRQGEEEDEEQLLYVVLVRLRLDAAQLALDRHRAARRVRCFEMLRRLTADQRVVRRRP